MLKSKSPWEPFNNDRKMQVSFHFKILMRIGHFISVWPIPTFSNQNTKYGERECDCITLFALFNHKVRQWIYHLIYDNIIWLIWLMITWHLFSVVCLDPLGMETGSINANQITSSSVFNSAHSTDNARLNCQGNETLAGSWSPLTNNLNQWIQVDFTLPIYISGMILQGRNVGEFLQWVTEYKVQFSIDGISWFYVKDSNRIDDMVRLRNMSDCIIRYNVTYRQLNTIIA